MNIRLLATVVMIKVYSTSWHDVTDADSARYGKTAVNPAMPGAPAWIMVGDRGVSFRCLVLNCLLDSHRQYHCLTAHPALLSLPPPASCLVTHTSIGHLQQVTISICVDLSRHHVETEHLSWCLNLRIQVKFALISSWVQCLDYSVVVFTLAQRIEISRLGRRNSEVQGTVVSETSVCVEGMPIEDK